jgi:hypothetical protein
MLKMPDLAIEAHETGIPPGGIPTLQERASAAAVGGPRAPEHTVGARTMRRTRTSGPVGPGSPTLGRLILVIIIPPFRCKPL